MICDFPGIRALAANLRAGEIDPAGLLGFLIFVMFLAIIAIAFLSPRGPK